MVGSWNRSRRVTREELYPVAPQKVGRRGGAWAGTRERAAGCTGQECRLTRASEGEGRVSADLTGAPVSRRGSWSSPGVQPRCLGRTCPRGWRCGAGGQVTRRRERAERPPPPLCAVVRPCPALIWQAARAPRGGARAGEPRRLRPASVSAGSLLPGFWCRISARSAGEERSRGGAPRDSAPQLPSRSPGARLARLAARRGTSRRPSAPAPRERRRTLRPPCPVHGGASPDRSRRRRQRAGDDLGVALGAGCSTGGLGA